MSTEIRNFYIGFGMSASHPQASSKMWTVHSLKRGELMFGSVCACALAVSNAVVSVFYLLGSLFTCFQSQLLSSALTRSMKKTIVCLGAIPVGFVGAVCPETVNTHFFGLPQQMPQAQIEKILGWV